MKLEDAKRIKMASANGTVTILAQDEFVLFLHQHSLSYRYTPKSARRGTLELFNDSIDLTFSIILYQV